MYCLLILDDVLLIDGGLLGLGQYGFDLGVGKFGCSIWAGFEKLDDDLPDLALFFGVLGTRFVVFAGWLWLGAGHHGLEVADALLPVGSHLSDYEL